MYCESDVWLKRALLPTLEKLSLIHVNAVGVRRQLVLTMHPDLTQCRANVASPRITSHHIASLRTASRRIKPHRIASRRVISDCIASHSTASHRIASSCIVLQPKAGHCLALYHTAWRGVAWGGVVVASSGYRAVAIEQNVKFALFSGRIR